MAEKLRASETSGILFFRPQSPMDLNQVLLRFYDNSEAAHNALAFGSVYCNKKRLSLAHLAGQIRFDHNDVFRLHLNPRRFFVPQPLLHRIVWQNSDILIINKPSGVPVHMTVDNAVENLISQLSQELKSTKPTPLFPIHRLDVETQGLLAIGKTRLGTQQFRQALTSGEIKKFYLALVAKNPGKGTFTHYMKPSKRSPKEVAQSPENPLWKPCTLRIHNVHEIAVNGCNYFELEIELLTGRTHQIRAQLKYLGSPILGDTLYGGPKSKEIFFALQAYRLQWDSQAPNTLATNLKLPPTGEWVLKAPWRDEPF